MIPLPLILVAALLLLKTPPATARTAKPAARVGMGTGSTSATPAYATPTDVAGQFARSVVASVYGAINTPGVMAREAAKEAGLSAAKAGDSYYTSRPEEVSVDLYATSAAYRFGDPFSLWAYADAIPGGPAFNTGQDVAMQFGGFNLGGSWAD